MPPETDGGRASPFALFYGGALRDGRTAVLARAVIGPVGILRRQSGGLLTVSGLNSWTAAFSICELTLSPHFDLSTQCSIKAGFKVQRSFV